MYTLYTPQEIAENIKNLAKAQHIVVKDMLDILDIGKNSIYTMRAGSYPRADTLAKIAAYLHTSVDALIYRGTEPEQAGDDQQPTEQRALVHTTKSAQAQACVYMRVCVRVCFILQVFRSGCMRNTVVDMRYMCMDAWCVQWCRICSVYMQYMRYIFDIIVIQ